MNENENNFESLRQLLALKRHEIPPPGYFEHFSDNVISRIRAGERERESASETLFSRAPWLLSFLRMFDAKPAFASSFAGALCLLLVFGIVYAERPDGQSQPALLQNAQMSQPLYASMTSGLGSVAQASEPGIFGITVSSNSASSLQPVSTLFGQQTPFMMQQASFSPAPSGN